MINVELIYDHRKGSKSGKSPIGTVEVRVIYKRKAYYISTGVRVHYKNFVAGGVVNQMDAQELNERLRLMVQRVQAEVNGALANGRDIDIADIRRRVWQVGVDSDDERSPLLEWFEEQVGMMRLRPGTKKRYAVVLSRLKDWGVMRKWRDVTVENVMRLDAWLHELPNTRLKVNGGGDGIAEEMTGLDSGISKGQTGQDESRLSDAAVYNYHKCVKCLLNRAVLLGRLDQNPYDRLKGQFRRGEKENVEFLTEDEMRRFCEVRPPVGTEMDVAHDLFVFQMYTGLAYADLQSFDMSEYKQVDGRWVNTGERVKTGVPYVSQLLPPAVAVLEKYGWKVPRMANAKYNLCLKALGLVAGISRPLHSHLARHTFATWMLRHDVPIEHVSRMLGHTNITQTQRYAKVQARAIYEDFDRVSKFVP